MHIIVQLHSFWFAIAPVIKIKRVILQALIAGIGIAVIQFVDYHHLYWGLGNKLFSEQLMLTSGTFAFFITFSLSMPLYCRQTELVTKKLTFFRNLALSLAVNCSVIAACVVSGVAIIVWLSGDTRSTLLFMIFYVYFLSSAELTANLLRLRQPSKLLVIMIGVVIALPLAAQIYKMDI